MRTFAVAVVAALLGSWSGSWVELGGSATGAGIGQESLNTSNPSLAIDSSNRPIVAWDSDDSGTRQIYLKMWDGTNWVERGGSGTGGGISNGSGGSDPSVALDSSGNPMVAWNSSSEIYLKRWNGTSWAELGGSATGGGISASAAVSQQPDSAVDSSGRPVVAWNENGEIYLKRWDGASWVQIGGSGAGGGISSTAGSSANPSLALDSSDNPIVAWEESTGGNNEIYLRRWNGSSWIDLGGSATNGGISANSGSSRVPSLALDSSGKPSVAWFDYTSGSAKIYFKRWDGANWIELAGSATGNGISNPAAISADASLVLDSSGNPIVAWAEYASGHAEIYLKRWNGSAWAEVEGSATGGGISNDANDSIGPSLALDRAGNPILAWIDADFSGDWRIYLKKFQSNDPAPADGGSDSGGGGGGCGLLGLEAAILAVALRWLRRFIR